MSKKTVKLTRREVAKLPDDKPVVCRILIGGGQNRYTGIAKRGRVRERVAEHLPWATDRVPGAKVQVEQVRRIEQARARAQRVIARTQPRYNKQGK